MCQDAIDAGVKIDDWRGGPAKGELVLDGAVRGVLTQQGERAWFLLIYRWRGGRPHVELSAGGALEWLLELLALAQATCCQGGGTCRMFQRNSAIGHDHGGAAHRLLTGKQPAGPDA